MLTIWGDIYVQFRYTRVNFGIGDCSRSIWTGKLPEVGKAIGKSINEFKGAMGGEKKKEEPKAVDTAETIDVEAGAKNDKRHKEVSDSSKEA